MRLGERANAKLRQAEVLAICRLKDEGGRLASSSGVSRADIEAIGYRRPWQQLAPETAGSGALVTDTP